MKETNSERKRKLRQIHKRAKTSIEAEQLSRASDVFYGIRQSKSQYENQRLALNLEKKEDAILLTKKRNYKQTVFLTKY